MTEPARTQMTADEFLTWAILARRRALELVAGEVVAMAPERAADGRLKGRIFRELSEAIERAGLPCEVYVDGMSVEVDANTLSEPYVLVRCGPPLPDDAIKAPGPVILVEVLSPSTRARDAGAKLEDYFRLESPDTIALPRPRTGPSFITCGMTPVRSRLGSCGMTLLCLMLRRSVARCFCLNSCSRAKDPRFNVGWFCCGERTKRLL